MERRNGKTKATNGAGYMNASGLTQLPCSIKWDNEKDGVYLCITSPNNTMHKTVSIPFEDLGIKNPQIIGGRLYGEKIDI